MSLVNSNIYTMKYLQIIAAVNPPIDIAIFQSVSECQSDE